MAARQGSKIINNIMESIYWKDIAGFEGKYMVSSNGEVFSFYKKELLKPYIRRQYYTVLLGRKQRPIHRLVALVFVPNISEKPQVNHKDGDKLNNSVTNLEWCSESENLQHAYDNNLKPRLYGEDNKFSKAVIQKTKDGGFVAEYVCIRLAEDKTKISHASIVSCLKGRLKSAGKHKWEYKR